ncbi:hypothetical protein EDC96DRAFT_593405 [Choanephora cucurbitarum]|nr:hypothetical protein EDC96DRAFT_593405 [Choanephora cucurbitarum]
MKLSVCISLLALPFMRAAVVPYSRQYRLDISHTALGNQRLCLSVGNCRYTCVSNFYDETSATVPKYRPHLCPDMADYTMSLIYPLRENPNAPGYIVNPSSTNIPCQYGGKSNEGHTYYYCPPKEEVYTSISAKTELNSNKAHQWIPATFLNYYDQDVFDRTINFLLSGKSCVKKLNPLHMMSLKWYLKRPFYRLLFASAFDLVMHKAV